jgi:L-ascorbate metabolism protein UlaG (beta-lactamase superfamily)
MVGNDNRNAKLMWFGHSCFKFNIGNTLFYFDPVRRTNMLKTTLKPAKEKKGAAILVSHEHWDHFDSETILALCTRTTKILCPISVAEPLYSRMAFDGSSLENLKKLTERIMPVEKNVIFKIDEVKVKCLEASEGVSFLINVGNRKILFMGDSTATTPMIEEKPDVVLFPVWAIIGEEAKLDDFLQLAKGALCIPMHFHTSKKALPNFYAKHKDIRNTVSNKINLKFIKKNKIYKI